MVSLGIPSGGITNQWIAAALFRSPSTLERFPYSKRGWLPGRAVYQEVGIDGILDT